MSMEIYVLSDRRLTSIAAWQRAIDAEGFGLALEASSPFERLNGHLPAMWQGRPAGFECDHFPPDEVLDGYPDAGFDRRWKYCLAFRWGADIRACLGAYMAASAYAKATGGVVLDSDAGKILSPEQTKREAAKIEQELPSFERRMQSMLAEIERRYHRPS